MTLLQNSMHSAIKIKRNFAQRQFALSVILIFPLPRIKLKFKESLILCLFALHRKLEDSETPQLATLYPLAGLLYFLTSSTTIHLSSKNKNLVRYLVSLLINTLLQNLHTILKFRQVVLEVTSADQYVGDPAYMPCSQLLFIHVNLIQQFDVNYCKKQAIILLSFTSHRRQVMCLNESFFKYFLENPLNCSQNPRNTLIYVKFPSCL